MERKENLKRITVIVERKVLNDNNPVWAKCFEREVPVDKLSSISRTIEVLHELFCLWSHRVIIKSE